MALYRSKYEAYPFLYDKSSNLCCDFELLTDEMASRTGLLRAHVKNEALREELIWVCELIYHINPTLRTHLTVTEEEYKHLFNITNRLRDECQHRCKLFVLPQGGVAASHAHLLRTQAKSAVRMIYHHIEQGHNVEPLLLDITNMLSSYFFALALKLNELEGIEEIPLISRNYNTK